MSSQDIDFERLRQSGLIALPINAGPTPPPARPPFRAARERWSGGLFAAVIRGVGNWMARRRLTSLMELDDHLLDDIGLRRDEIAWALTLPLDHHPAEAIKHRRQARRGREHWIGRFKLAAEEQSPRMQATGAGGAALCTCGK